MTQMDLSHIPQFIPAALRGGPAAQLRLAHSHLQHGDGAGGEFTGWVQLPREYHREEFARIQAAARKIQQDSQALVVIGIGGSYLGARGVIECLRSPNYNLKKKDTPDIYFTGNGLSSDQLAELMDLLEGWTSPSTSSPSPVPPPSLPWRSGSSGSCWRSGTAVKRPPAGSTPPPTGKERGR